MVVSKLRVHQLAIPNLSLCNVAITAFGGSRKVLPLKSAFSTSFAILSATILALRSTFSRRCASPLSVSRIIFLAPMFYACDNPSTIPHSSASTSVQIPIALEYPFASIVPNYTAARSISICLVPCSVRVELDPFDSWSLPLWRFSFAFRLTSIHTFDVYLQEFIELFWFDKWLPCFHSCWTFPKQMLQCFHTGSTDSTFVIGVHVSTYSLAVCKYLPYATNHKNIFTLCIPLN
ncbi:hypothetical protein F3Y22_tig00110676pilonHSYRG00124 [Hibiscus syriacus]|uniref:Uncharacterized protein n=1 Tax=Hibiscus syriacus TaxID=106335 RepID=A0A6A2ZY62_HIBSY|nr:hypothetical protein F3Y22_tig00110676pilonHSYRG00124 [Hibiscus syriacus]